ncbi:MAG: hypothetical protein A2268_10335 [Candidatus Raymondbacteria bacterium RifOxyA12_full_50_37]|uniref:Anti-sigma factor antagonist n=1 Tax=Candidatus Raymondbacteria bacterium RIFOXYD12_FULL_49_13 TaxID=1817890 RepID=A0A1F7FKY0_UNCRA|nr:MAG: hypothetical protein A2268_10335 [Candidatus Raymondbacteria bacterium RifOxyA12_full_50_37]OGJ90160.1 MAG: hypothetical protein A2248_16815 [Candidatus Raymondbacteria bacterium RIFOXYA2_FULL_49_16]OGJ97231.1 MAG: hypothetical protein A2453_01305 [Candidatus Raymondbacteria bacterium RIFOXYC2_FULL_50_21]OGK04498.1 MAG: hypothetical protein A2350_15350 [Candidatus Raymondbacteria bacterium RifOxyB12_full_50_8]OGK06500.1 MAG: hypothetical protein A2487_21445 [Candidatus Raymondbacteria b
MKIETTVVGPVDIINIEGGIMQENVAHFKKALHDLLDANKIRLVLNIEKTNYLSSMSLSVIFAARNKARGNGGDLKIANPNNLVRNLFSFTNLSLEIKLYDTVDEAVKSFS